eukprot:15120700-Alexandrium_andersonii.AAC.1
MSLFHIWWLSAGTQANYPWTEQHVLQAGSVLKVQAACGQVRALPLEVERVRSGDQLTVAS